MVRTKKARRGKAAAASRPTRQDRAAAPAPAVAPADAAAAPLPPRANTDALVVARGPRARQLQAEFGSAVSAKEAEEVMRYAGGSVEVAGALLRNKLGLPRKRKRDGNEEAELSMREVEIGRLRVKAYEYLCRVVSLKAADYAAQRANAQNFLNSDQEFVRSITQSLKRDASIQDAAVRELVESPTDEIAEKVVSAILDGDLIDDMPDAVKEGLMENEHLRDAVRDELHDDDELRDEVREDLRESVREDLLDDDELRAEVKKEIEAGILQQHSETERARGAWREISVLPAVSARYDRYHCVDCALGQPVAHFLMDLLHGTRRRHRGLAPPDGTGEHVRPAPSFHVLKIERIFNPRLMNDYQVQLDNIRGKHGNRPVTGIQPIPLRGAAGAGPFAHCDDEPIIKRYQEVNGSEWNERYLFHGAPADKIEKICQGGLDYRRAGTHMGDLFGMGTYLAEDSSKSDIYAKPDAHGIKCMLVCRVCLGETWYTREPLRRISMPPDDRDSVTALRLDEGGCVDHREYVVYERGQAIPEYRIYYHHARGCRCSICVQ